MVTKHIFSIIMSKYHNVCKHNINIKRKLYRFHYNHYPLIERVFIKGQFELV